MVGVSLTGSPEPLHVVSPSFASSCRDEVSLSCMWSGAHAGTSRRRPESWTMLMESPLKQWAWQSDTSASLTEVFCCCQWQLRSRTVRACSLSVRCPNLTERRATPTTRRRGKTDEQQKLGRGGQRTRAVCPKGAACDVEMLTALWRPIFASFRETNGPLLAQMVLNRHPRQGRAAEC